MKKRQRIKVGDVFQIDLPDGRFAYCRLYRDATIGVYRQVSSEGKSPPIRSRDFLFQVGIRESILTSGLFALVGHDKFEKSESSWPDPTFILDPIAKTYSIYYQGKMKKASKDECADLERTVVWDDDLIIKRTIAMLKETSS